MHLPAISIGYAVPKGNFNASVHSIFQSALNLRLQKSDELITLVVSDEADLPQGIRLETHKDFSFEIFSLGEPVICQDGNLRIDSLTVDLRGVQRWKCDLSALKADTTIPAVASAWKYVWNVLNERQKLSEAEIIAEDLFHSDEINPTRVSHKTGEAIRNLLNITRQYDSNDTSAIDSLIGLGSGLTPSGDDLLVGYLAGLCCTVRDQSDRALFLADLGERIIHLSRQTNDISRTYLYHAARGQVSSRLANLAKAISRGEEPERLFAAAESAMRVGHTSGMDAVTGLMIGLTAWINLPARG